MVNKKKEKYLSDAYYELHEHYGYGEDVTQDSFGQHVDHIISSRWSGTLFRELMIFTPTYDMFVMFSFIWQGYHDYVE